MPKPPQRPTIKRSRPSVPTISANKHKVRTYPTKRKSSQATTGKPLAIVGLGASAGGLDAFRRFFSQMAPNSGIAFVLIQHLDPEHKSEMAPLLARQTAMTVVEALDGQHVRPNCVYVIPPNVALAISGGRLRLTAPSEERGKRMPIDFFFRSLASDCRQRCIGIVLSGTGSDGTLGSREIRAVGGLTIAQNPKTAEHDGMPLSAIGSGAIDHVLDVERIPEMIIKYVHHPYIKLPTDRESAPRQTQSHFQSVLSLIRDRARFDFTSYKPGTLERRIQRRMSLRHITLPNRYLDVLQDDPTELGALVKDLLIGVTHFLREPDAWKALQNQVIRPLVKSKHSNDSIRMWVPGCATGEEAYSLGMLLLDELTAAKKRCPIQIFASDVNREAFGAARKGIYSESLMTNISPQRLRRYFVRQGDHYHVRRELRDTVVFAEQNVLADPPFSRLDLITCRNLLIYLEPAAQARIMALFHYALGAGGHVLLGSAETVNEASGMFACVSRKWRIYRRIGTIRSEPPALPMIPGQVPARMAASKPVAADNPRFNEMAQQLVLDRYAPACVMINPKTEILFTSGPTADFLRQPRGRMQTDLLSWVPDSLRGRLRAALKKAQAEEKVATLCDIRISRGKGTQSVTLTVEPLKAPRLAEGLLLVTFRRTSPLARPAVNSRKISEVEDESLLALMEDDLKTTREDLQGSIDQLETTNEELKASNEEVTSINEELQSSNEELETSKEELQSLNEELTTVNSQLQVKVEELESKTNDLDNLLASTDIATLFLDRRGYVKWFTSPTTRLLRLLPTDIGRPISDFAQKFTGSDLIAETKEVLRSLTPAENEIRGHDGRWYLRRIVPYRTADDRIEGVVVTFVDIHRSKTAEEDVRRLALVLKDSNDAVIVQDLSGNIQAWNRGACEMYGYSDTEAIGDSAHRLLPANKRSEMRALVERFKRGEIISAALETQRLTKDDRTLDISITATAVSDDTGKVIGIGTTERDISQNKRNEKELRQLNESLEQQAQRLRDMTAQLLTTEEQERRKLSLELHDTLAQLLHVAKMKLSGLRSRPEKPQALQEVRRLLDEATEAARFMSYQLSPPVLYELGLIPAVQWLADEMKRIYHLNVTIRSANTPTLDERTRTILFRALRELLVNVAKHAGVSRARVDIRRKNKSIILTVEDYGVGFDPKRIWNSRKMRGLGLFSIRERLNYLGGNMEIESIPRKKTTVALALPLAPGNDAGVGDRTR